MSIAWENNTSALETQEFSIDPIINQKIKSAVQGLQKSINSLKSLVSLGYHLIF
jgi:hypothetical protein